MIMFTFVKYENIVNFEFKVRNNSIHLFFYIIRII